MSPENKMYLHEMVISNRLPEVKDAIRRGVNLNVQDHKGWTPLHYAAQDDDLFKMAQLLLKSGAKINNKTYNSDTALIIACQFSSQNIINLLLSYKKCEIDHQNRDRWSALHFACQEGNLQIVQRLLDAGAEIDLEDHRGNTPLCAAIVNNHNVEVSRMLLDAGAHIYWADTATFLNYVCWRNNIELFDLLIKYLPDFENVLDRRIADFTSLMLAAKRRNFHFIQTLIDCGADMSLTDEYGYLALHYVIFNYSVSDKDNWLKCFKLLLEKTPIHVIEKCSNGHLVYFELFNRSLPGLLLEKQSFEGLSLLFSFGFSTDVVLSPMLLNFLQPYSPICYMLYLAEKKKLSDVLKYLDLLLSQKELVDPHNYDLEEEGVGVSPLLAAIEMHNKDHENCICSIVLTRILEKGANPDYCRETKGVPEAFKAAIKNRNVDAINILFNYSSHYPEDIAVFMARESKDDWVLRIEYLYKPLVHEELFCRNLNETGPKRDLICDQNLPSLKRLSRFQVWIQMMEDTQSTFLFFENLELLDIPKSLISFLTCLD